MDTQTRQGIPPGLRVADLVAKTARVTLKDTMRVMLALDAVAYLYDVDPVEVLEACDYQPCRPAPEYVAACERSYFELKSARSADIAERIRKIKALV